MVLTLGEIVFEHVVSMSSSQSDIVHVSMSINEPRSYNFVGTIDDGSVSLVLDTLRDALDGVALDENIGFQGFCTIAFVMHDDDSVLEKNGVAGGHSESTANSR